MRSGTWGKACLETAAVVVAATMIFALLRPFVGESGAAILYMLAVVVSATRAGLRAAVLTSILSFVCWNFFFVPPVGTFFIEEPKALIILLIYLTVAIITGQLASGAQQRALEAQEREQHTAMLYELSLMMSAEVRADSALARLARQVMTMCLRGGCAFWQIGNGKDFRLMAQASQPDIHLPDLSRFPGRELARIVADSGLQIDMQEDRAFWEKAVASASTPYPEEAGERSAMYLPLYAADRMVGIMVTAPDAEVSGLSPARERLLKTAANHAAVVIERDRVLQAAGDAQAQLEAERLRSSLLSSVSHDLRTPLASIKAAATGLLANRGALDEDACQELQKTIVHNADRLNNLVGNLLDMSRLEAGAWLPDLEEMPFSEIVATVLQRLTDAEASRLTVDLPEDLPMALLDEVQIEQVLWNLLENAFKYTPPASPITLQAAVRQEFLEISLRDCGPGIALGEEERIFEKFYRLPAHAGGAPLGSGIGLSICKGIIEAHDGKIRAANAPGGGAIFSFTLPLEKAAQNRQDTGDG